MEKSQEDFQKDILEILKQQGKNMEEFKKEVKEELTKKSSETAQKEQTIDKDSGFSYMTTFAISSKIILSEEEVKIKVQRVSIEMKDLMKKYQLSKLECFIIREYE